MYASLCGRHTGCAGSLSNRSYVWRSPGPGGLFFRVLFQPGGQAECGQPPPACGRRVVHTERAGSSVDNPGTGAAGCPRPCGVGSWLSTRASAAIVVRPGCFDFAIFFFQPPAGAAGGPPVEPCTHGSTLLAVSAVADRLPQRAGVRAGSCFLSGLCGCIGTEFRIVLMSRCTSVYMFGWSGCKHQLFAGNLTNRLRLN